MDIWVLGQLGGGAGQRDWAQGFCRGLGGTCTVVYMFVLCTRTLWPHSHSKELVPEGCELPTLLPLHSLP